jgi:hypothetical protein
VGSVGCGKMIVLSDWSLDDVRSPVGVTLLGHVERALAEFGPGPLPDPMQELPHEPPRDPSKLSWIAGAFDSLGLSGSEMAEDAPNAAAAAVSAVTRVPPDTSVVLAFAELIGEVNGPRAIDQFIDAIRHDAELDLSRVAKLGRWLCCNGTRKATVKVGLALLGTAGDESDSFLIQRLGLLEELTLYAVVALRNLLAEPDPAIFALAQSVSGWGRINAVRRLAGTTDPEIKHWLLRGGAENGVMTEEIAYIAASTGDLRSALERESDEELLEHGTELLRALAQGGPAKDMSDYEDGAASLAAFFQHMSSADLTPRRVDCIAYLERYLAEWAQDNPLISEDQRRSLLASATQVLARPGCVLAVNGLLSSDQILDVTRGLSLADRFEIDGRTIAKGWLQRLPFNGYLWQWMFRHTGADDLDSTLKEAYRLLPLSQLATGPQDSLGLGKSYEADSALQTIVQALRHFPGAGWPLVATALNNRVTRSRNGALQVLNAWPVEKWPEQAREALTAARDAEPNADVRSRIQALLDDGKLPDRH